MSAKITAEMLYGMDCMDSCQGEQYWITRVPGGWVFEATTGTVFIPFDNEFLRGSTLAAKEKGDN